MDGSKVRYGNKGDNHAIGWVAREMASNPFGNSISYDSIHGGAAIRRQQYQQRLRRNEIIDARKMSHLQQHQFIESEERRRMTYQRQLQEEEYNRSIASPGSSSSRMSRQQLAQRRLERRRLERRQLTNELRSQTIPMRSQQSEHPIHQPSLPLPPPPSGTSPRSIMKKTSTYQTMRDQQYFHNHQSTSSNYSTDSSSNFVSPPIMNRKQIPECGPIIHSKNQVFTQNGVVIDPTAFRPNRNNLSRLPHDSPSDEWSRKGSSISHSRGGQHNTYQQYQQNPQIYVPDTPSQSSISHECDQRPQMSGIHIRQPNWHEIDQQRLIYQKQFASRNRRHMEQQQHFSYASDEEGPDNDDRRVNVSYNSQSGTPRSRSNSRERQIPRRWRHNRAAASAGKDDMNTSSLSIKTPVTNQDSSQFQYTPRSKLAISESLAQSDVNTPMSSHSRSGGRLEEMRYPLNNNRHGWRQNDSQHQHQQHQNQPPATEYGWGRQDRHYQHGWTPSQDHPIRVQNVVSPSRSEASPYSDKSQETASVASIKKSWEGRTKPNERQQRGRRRDASSNGENPFGVWEERDSRISKLREGEQRREQRKNMENKWRRNSSLPPERRRGYGWRQDEYSDGYHSDGAHRSQHDRFDVDASPLVTRQDARRRLWDQDERLRAVLPKTESFDSIGDVRNRPLQRPLPSVGLASPGNVSTLSTGSALFKSKFVHAAALATQRRDLGHQKSPHFPIKIEDESPKGSSQITDSTADTTAPSSNHTSRGENANSSQFAKHPAQPTATMPSIAEAPQVSVADLISRINAVSRDNPAEALARIDSIIKGETAGEGIKSRQQNNGISSLFKFDSVTKQESKMPCKEDVTDHPRVTRPSDRQGDKRFVFDDDDDHEHDDPSIDDSLLSSGESTVSSMTNPTYQSVNEIRRKKSLTNNLNPPKKSESERKTSSPQFVTNTIKGVDYHMSIEKQETRSNRFGDDGPLTQAKLQSFDNDNYWASAPQSDFFNDSGGLRTASNQAVEPRFSTTRESKMTRRPATPELMTVVTSAFSDVNISFGDTDTTKDLLAKVFSDVDDTCRKQNVLASAFSDVDISMEQKTVSQRRKELEQLSTSWIGTDGWSKEEPKKSPPKQKKKVEPPFRLKSNMKLTQKFANLVKAFEK